MNYSLPNGHEVDFEYFLCRTESSCQMQQTFESKSWHLLEDK